jgi:7-cyano-7-deazaguanine synthase
MDSIALALCAHRFAITVDYGQRPAEAEIRGASAVCSELGIDHHIIRSDLSALGSGDIASRPALAIAPISEWWPFRNQMLVTLAAMRHIELGVERLLTTFRRKIRPSGQRQTPTEVASWC